METVDRYAHLTEAQRRAIRTIDRSVLVSAAAGSGKTTVLAERCAHLVCDLPARQRCSVNELLVVTFTDAAAGEMRNRIGAALRQRIAERSRDAYLREQLYLLDSASISTIHAFCKTIVQKWFPQAGIDPQAALLSGDEAELLRRETLEALFRELYARDDELGVAFRTLVDEYGAGDDWQIGELVLQVHAFINSLPDPDEWLDKAAAQFDPSNPDSLVARVDVLQAERLSLELQRQCEYAHFVARSIRQTWPIAVTRVEAAEALAQTLHDWYEQLGGKPASWSVVAESIRSFTFDRLKARPRDLSDEDKHAYEAATRQYEQLKKLFNRRAQEGLCRFTADEYREGLARTAPFVRTLADIVRALEAGYAQAKSAQAAMDFNDLQRKALQLLAEDGDAHRPSAVARQLQQQYRYVLVDEFQDVDPLQEAILRLVSRESADPPAGNLFTVGDIKQSIYRFRLAEPTLFTERAKSFVRAGALGEVIHLQENFRSRSGVIDAVNLVFRRLMSEQFGGSAYDAEAELHAAATYPADDVVTFSLPAVEMHLLEPITQLTQAAASENDEEGSGITNADTDAGDELEGIEREAFLIAQQIRTWMGSDGNAGRQVAARPATPGGPPTTRPIEYGDIVILLRAMLHKAEPIAEVLRRMGIPVHIEGANDQLDSTEFRDVHSLLSVLDNEQQDIPLAAVLRSPLLEDSLSTSELLSIRLIDRSMPFYAAVRAYTLNGDDEELRQRVSTMLKRLEYFRQRLHSVRLADVLWEVYEQTGYLAFVSGLPDGVQRRQQLMRLHELARQFGRFARQGLRRFLRFLDEMVEQDRGGPPAAATAGDNAVRIMSVHASKGLEFPVVILPDLQKRFNQADMSGMALVDRKLGIALQAADAERRIRYPTLLHQLACEQARQESLSEELRVLYVALTRAREHLVLIGRCSLASIEACRASSDAATERVPGLKLESAHTVLDWLLPVVGTLPAGVVDWSGSRQTQSLMSVHVYERADTDMWRIPPAQRPEAAEGLARIARLEPLPAEEPVADVPAVHELIASLGFEYPAAELTSVPARVSVSELKRRWQANLDSEEQPSRSAPQHVATPAFMQDASAVPDAATRGTATHRFLQLADLAGRCDAADLQRQREAMIAAGRLTVADAALVSLDDVAWFMQSELGRRIRTNEQYVQREVPFVARVSCERYDAALRPQDHRDVLLVRGMVDLVLSVDAKGRGQTQTPQNTSAETPTTLWEAAAQWRSEAKQNKAGSLPASQAEAGESRPELEIVDFKTDDVSEERCAERAEQYRPQLAYYAEALTDAWGLPVGRQWLVFLRARQIIDLASADGD